MKLLERLEDIENQSTKWALENRFLTLEPKVEIFDDLSAAFLEAVELIKEFTKQECKINCEVRKNIHNIFCEVQKEFLKKIGASE